MVQFEQLLLVCIAGYCITFSFKYLPPLLPIILSLSQTCCNAIRRPLCNVCEPMYCWISSPSFPFHQIRYHIMYTRTRPPGCMAKPLKFLSTCNFQKRLVVSNHLFFVRFHSFVWNSVSPTYFPQNQNQKCIYSILTRMYQPSGASHFKCHYSLLYPGIVSLRFTAV